MSAPLPDVPALSAMPRRQRRSLAQGLIAQTQGDYAEAMRCYRAVAKRDPDDFLSLYFAALTAFQLKEKETAVRLMYGSLHRNPQHPEAWYNLGKFYQDLDQPQRAAECYVAALELRPDFGQALVNGGNVFWELGDEVLAEACYSKAITATGGGYEGVYNLSFLLQLRGEWPAAWEAMEARWQCPAYYVDYKKGFMEGEGALPRWHGEDIPEGKRLLLHGEQGAGDIIQMLRYIPQLADKVNGRLAVGVFDSMVRLCEHSFPGVRFLGTDGDMSDCIAHLPSMSLPYAMKTTWENLPPRCPYLHAEPVLPKGDKLRVAFCWAGSKTHPRDKARSMPATQLLSLVHPDIEWVNVQVGETTLDWTQATDTPPPIAGLTTEADYYETARLLTSCDLLISVDTSVCHLAGALGVETWMLVARFPDVRWMLGRADTVWYSKMQIFRQHVAGDWSECLHIVKQLLDLKVQFRDKGL